jgi:hypothetical protein
MVRLRRFGIGLALGAALLAVAAGPVAAAKPDRSFAEAGEVLITGFCEFDVVQTIVSNNEYNTTFFDRAGNVTRTQVNGRLVVGLTNVETGKSIVLNASGPGRFVEDTDGLTVYTGGTWTLFFAGEFFLLNGRGILRIDANGETIVATHGHITDLCELLAD